MAVSLAMEFFVSSVSFCLYSRRHRPNTIVRKDVVAKSQGRVIWMSEPQRAKGWACRDGLGDEQQIPLIFKSTVVFSHAKHPRFPRFCMNELACLEKVALIQKAHTHTECKESRQTTEMAASIAFSTGLHPQAWPGGTDISRAGAVMATASRMANLTTLPEESRQQRSPGTLR
ncbi:hypothetical protein TEQG_08472 [Trichophyton equinum CBS 127.97]|uniref:Uncharacterized protein n=1 Tax=Trichophyton equinum (strain ATCC MYA-4606 / CBS 127.97) TaxID=559882 RepID=F2Q5V0_TRIEC|nr:hypothetical protein TEQG_08472 [Trichophyton equinum CBS 127.97]